MDSPHNLDNGLVDQFAWCATRLRSFDDTGMNAQSSLQEL